MARRLMHFNKRIRYKGTNNAEEEGINFGSSGEKTMPTTRRLFLTEEQRHQLTHLRDASPKPYLRERAAALLKIAAGLSAAQVAHQGLLRVRQPDTVYRWLNAFQTVGIEGLKVKPGAGRKPAFSPSATRPTSSSRRPALPGEARPTSVRPTTSQVDPTDDQGGV
jgi:hypothetical protein